MADTSLIFNIVARDQASSTFDKIKGKAAVLGAAAAALAIKFGKDSVDAYVEAEQSQNKLQAAFAKFPGLADTNIDRLNTLNATLAKKTKFDDDATASGQAVLAQFKLTGSQIEQLTPLLQDYAAKTGKDLPTAAGDLGKAMLGQGRALKAIGLDFQDTGSASGNFAEIMGGLRTQVGGFAESEGKTAAGQAAIMKNQFGELQESVGSKLVPALTALAGKLVTVIGFVQENSAVIGPLVAIGGGLAAVIYAIITAQKIWAATQAALNVVMTANPIGIVIVAIAALVAGVILAYRHSETFRSIVQGAFNGVRAAGETMWDVLKTVFGFIVDKFLWVAGTIVHAAADAFGWIPGLGGKLRDAADRFDTFRAQVNASINGVTDHVTVRIATQGGSAAIAEIADLQYRINQVPRSVTTQFLVKSESIPRRASGGPVSAGQTYLVGENGPEFITGVTGTVHSAGETRQMMGTPTAAGTGSGGITIQNLSLPNVTDPASFVRALQDYTRLNGPIRGVRFA